MNAPRSSGRSSSAYGPCEVCGRAAADVWIGALRNGEVHVFGHEKCVRKRLAVEAKREAQP